METPESLSLKQNGLVEVSGWDEDEIFFVERSELDWDELFACKHVTLTHMLSEGSIIFVRPILHGHASRESHPLRSRICWLQPRRSPQVPVEWSAAALWGGNFSVN